jgi:hypothetical protein
MLSQYGSRGQAPSPGRFNDGGLDDASLEYFTINGGVAEDERRLAGDDWGVLSMNRLMDMDPRSRRVTRVDGLEERSVQQKDVRASTAGINGGHDTGGRVNAYDAGAAQDVNGAAVAGPR